MNTNTTHTPGAIRIAEIIIPEGIDRKGHPSRVATAYGQKTREGIADMIDRETAAPELLEALKMLHGYARESDAAYRNGFGGTDLLYSAVDAAIAKAEGRAE